ncbi:cyclin-like protein, partial [Myriangium duriaei CBS 260.36]
EGAKICTNCGTQISEQNIVAEVTFGETSTGAATVQGGFVGETARHAKTLGAAASRRIGGQYQSREETEQNGRSELRQLCPLLRIPGNVEDIAFNLWKLAAAQNFIQGRRTNEVAGICLYAACRREKHNTILLIDISEALSVNVYRLGNIYKELSKALYLEVHSHVQPVVEIEPLLMKYCSKLEFGDKTRNVAEDAAKIVKRMKRDWMVTGRHPSGLCGACIVLAARMNNFRRTVREVVYVVKASEITIGSRLSEFKRTRSSTMSVEDFRNKSHRLKHQHDPPSVTAAADRHKRQKRIIEQRSARVEARRSQDVETISSRQSSEAPSEVSTDSPDPSPSQPTNTSGENAPARRDADGFAIPALPNAQSGESSASQTTKKRGRTKAGAIPKVTLTEADFALEHELETDIEHILQDPNCVSARDDTEREKLTQRSEQLATQQRSLSAAASAARQNIAGRTNKVSDSVEIEDWEFADDPEVQNALLPEEAVKVKETIWLRDNEDWLRHQQAKYLKAELERADGGRNKQKKKRKRSRMGDGTVLTDGGTPVMSPADAAQRMLEKRAGKNISKAINYAMLNQVFG